MRWFKHISRTTSDDKIARLIARHGHAGYGLWWMVLETVAEHIEKGSEDCSVMLPRKSWASRLHIYPNRVSSSLRSLAELKLISISTRRDELQVSIPNLRKYRDEYTFRVGSRSGVNREPHVTSESESDVRGQSQSQLTDKDKKKPEAVSQSANDYDADNGKTNGTPNGQPKNLWELLKIDKSRLPRKADLSAKLLEGRWNEQGQPRAGPELAKFIDDALLFFTASGIQYAKVMLLRLKQQQRGHR
jgi:hypothetical protein